MRNSQANGGKPIKEVEKLRARKAKLERVVSNSTERKQAEEALRRSKQDWESTFNAISDWIVLMDLKGRILRTNPIGEEFVGVPVAEMVGQTCCKLVHGSDTPLPGCPLLKMLQSGRSEAMELQLPNSSRWLVITVEPIRDENGTLVGAVHITRDITGLKLFETEQELMIELLHLLNATNQKHELMELVTKFLKDWSGCEAIGIRLQEGEDFPYYVTRGFPEEFILVENKLCAVNELGEIERDSQGRPYLECMCGNVISGRFDPSKPFFTEHGSFWTNSTTELPVGTTEADRMARTHNRCNTAGYESVALIPLRTGTETFGLLQFNDKQKGRFTPERISMFERLANSLAIGLAQRRAEKALLRSREGYAKAARIGHFGHWERDFVENKSYWSKETYDIFAVEPEQFEPTYENFQNCVHPADRESMKNSVSNTLKRGGVLDIEYRIRRPNGEVRHIHSVAESILDKSGKAVKLVGTVHDITEHKKTEEELIENQAKFKVMASKILMSEERERQHLAVRLHDSLCQKLVLTKLALESSLNLVSDSNLLASLKIVAAGIGETIEKADSLTFELSNPILRELGFVIALEKYLTEEIQQKHQIEFELLSDKKPVNLHDEIKNCLFRVTLELLTNVVKHAQASKVKVSVRKSRGRIYVSVQDDGVGIKESQASATVSKTTRFGLFSIREQLEYLGGHLKIESEPGHGTVAMVVLPLEKHAVTSG